MPRSIDWLRKRAQKGAPSAADAPPTPPEGAPPETTTPEATSSPETPDEALPVESEPAPETPELEGLPEEAGATPASEVPPAGEAAPISGHQPAEALVRAIAAVLAAAQQGPSEIRAHIRAITETARLMLHDETALAEFELWLAEHQAEIAQNLSLGDLVQKGAITFLYAIKVGKLLFADEDRRIKLALLGALHHVGFARVPKEILHKQGKLSSQERALLTRAWEEGAAWLAKAGLDDAEILRAIRETPERVDGSGPRGLAGSEISELGQVIGLLTTFEALVHPRPWRRKLTPREAVALLVKEHKHQFDREMLKALIEAISLYPVGSWVELNTHEIARVIRVHERHPLRPIVETVWNKDGKRVQPRRIDLLKNPHLRIERIVDSEELPSA